MLMHYKLILFLAILSQNYKGYKCTQATCIFEKNSIMTKWITCKKTCSFFLSNVSKGISYLRVRLYVGYVFILPDTQDTYVTRHSNSILYRVWKECIRLLVPTTRGEENTKVKKENPKKRPISFRC